MVSVLLNVGTDDLSGIVEFSGDMSKGMKDQGNPEMPAEVFETLEENHYLEFDEAIEKYGVEDELTAVVKFYCPVIFHLPLFCIQKVLWPGLL